MSINIEDRTGTVVQVREYEEAIGVVTRYCVLTELTKLPPELAVQMMNIRRCLLQGHALTASALNTKRNADDQA
jgi:hypothetical protein